MIENRRGLTIFSHTMLILGIAVILFPLYVAFVAATLDSKAVFDTPMTLIPGGHLLENMKFYLGERRRANSAPFWLMMLNSFIMAFGITVGQNYGLDAFRFRHRLVSLFRCVTCSSG